MEIIWTETALTTFFNVVDYLFDNWSAKDVENFENNVDQLIERIASYNQICPESKLFGYRNCIVDEHNSLIYHIEDKKLLLITFIDNRSQHSY